MVIKVDDEHYDSRGSLEPTQVDLTVVTKTFDYFEPDSFHWVELSLKGDPYAIRLTLLNMNESNNCKRTYFYDSNSRPFNPDKLIAQEPVLMEGDPRHEVIQRGNVAIKIKVHNYRPSSDAYEINLAGEKSAVCRAIKAHLHDTPRCNFSYLEARTEAPLLRTEILGGSVPFLSEEDSQSVQSNAAESIRVRILYYEFGAIDRAEQLTVSGTKENVARFIVDNLKDIPKEIEHQFALSSEDRWLTTTQLLQEDQFHFCK